MLIQSERRNLVSKQGIGIVCIKKDEKSPVWHPFTGLPFPSHSPWPPPLPPQNRGWRLEFSS